MAFAQSLSATMYALPASQRAELDPAVMEPSFLKIAGSLARDSREVSSRGISSVSKTMVPFFLSFISTGTISEAKRPSLIAATAFLWLPRAYSSCSSRVMEYSSLRISAVAPMSIPARGQLKPSL